MSSLPSALQEIRQRHEYKRADRHSLVVLRVLNHSPFEPFHFNMKRSASASTGSDHDDSVASDRTLHDCIGQDYHPNPSSKSGSPGRLDDRRIWIPSHHSNRTLVLCFDGTGDEFDSDVSRVEGGSSA